MCCNVVGTPSIGDGKMRGARRVQYDRACEEFVRGTG